MKFIKKNKSSLLSINKIQDFIVVFSLFLFASILVLGLFPKTDASEEAGRLFFIYTMMSIPVIVAIYFIIISFRRKISKDTSEVDTSIKTKMALAFLFVAIIPSLPIVLISNNVINRAIGELISADTSFALDKAIEMSDDNVSEISARMRNDLEWIKYSIDNGIFNINDFNTREHITSIVRKRGLIFKFYNVLEENELHNKLSSMPGDAGALNFSDGVEEYLSLIDYSDNIFISKINVDNTSILVGGYSIKNYLAVFYRIIPEKLYTRISFFNQAKKRYDKKTFLRPYIQSISGLLLFILSIAIVVFSIGVSIVLSKNITKPVLELENSARLVALGDFSIRLYRDTSDELSLLYNSFNTMVRQLNESRKAMFHMQKIKAWGEVGNKLLHEIKNPLTPIRLSAERMRKRFIEKHDNIEKIILNGTETIIEEVNALQHILSEFSQFARLPKAKLEVNNINLIVKNCGKIFYGHENINFIYNFNENLPDIPFDKILIRQALINIIKNAVEALNENGQIKISTGLIEEINHIFIKIKDDGPGISEDDIEMLFEPSFSKKENGNGLGLAIVEKIVFEHNGKIFCNSKIGKGTTFIIELPVENIQIVSEDSQKEI